MFSPLPIGHVKSPYQSTQQIPKGCGTKHDVEGSLEILPQFETGLLDIEGFSHLIVLWVFDRVEGFELLASPPTDNRQHGVFATRSPQRPNPIGLNGGRTPPPRKDDSLRSRPRHARRNPNSRSQALSFQHPGRNATARLVGRSGSSPPEIAAEATR